MSETSNTGKDLFDHLKFISGQDNLSEEEANRLMKYAVDAYSAIALSADGVDKFDDTTHKNSDGDPTYPVSTSIVTASNSKVPLDKTFLKIDRMAVIVDGVEKPLIHIDRSQHPDQSLTEVFPGTGVPTHWDYDAHSAEVYPHADGEYTVIAYHSRAAKYIDVENDTEEIGIPRIHHEYLILHSCRQLGFRIVDANRVDIANELVKWEGREVDGIQSGGKIREHYKRRNQTKSHRVRPKLSNVRTFI